MAKVLIIAPQWMGDAVMTHSLIQLVAKKNTVDVLCVSWLEPIYQRMQNNH
jgi:ADP-heptose:LPS heptosyltransferase